MVARRTFLLIAVVWCLAAPGLAHAAQTIVSLTFDDGKASQYSMRPVLTSHGMDATFFVNSNTIDESFSMSWQQLHDLASDGNEIGGHTLDHLDLTTLSAASATEQICNDRQALIAHGFTPANFAYPYGAFNSGLEQIVQGCGYSSARGVSGLWNSCDSCPYAETIPPLDAYITRSVGGPVSTTSLSEIEGYVTQAEQHGGGWVQITFHQICDNCEEYSTSLATVTAFLDWLQPRSASGTVVRTVEQALGSSPPPTDLTPPVTTVACNGAGCLASAYTAPVTVTLSATDTGGVGVSATRYTTNGADPTTSSSLYTSALTISGTTTLKYRSWDANNNAETTKTQTITITPPPTDLTPPVTTVACNGAGCLASAYTAPVTVTLSATDTGGVGVSATRYTTNGADPTTSSSLYTSALTISGTTTLKYRSWDANNNAETTKTQTITITPPPTDLTPPVTTVACNGAGCLASAYTAPVTVTLSATDTGGVGVSATRYTTNGADPTTSSSLYTSALTISGTTTLKYRSWDANNNAETTKTQTITITPPPTGTTVEKAKGKPATSSSNEASPWAIPSSANDGNTNSRWSSDFLANQWWQVDLGAITALTSVDITFCDWAWPATYTVSVSTNGTTWTVVANETLTSSGSKRKISTFAQTNARYVRITGLTRGTQFGTSIVEAQIYGPSDTSTPPPTDLTPPVTTVACNGAGCLASAYTAPVTVTLSATDTGGVGVSATRYTTNGADPTTSSSLYTSALTISGTTTLKYRSWDANNNAETTKTQTITITPPPTDLTPPVTTVACNGAGCLASAYTAPVTVTLSATDTGGVGVSATRYTTNGADPTTSSSLYTSALTISGTTTLKYRSWDANNNAETTKTQTITITPPPTGTTVEKAKGKPATSSSNEASPWAIPSSANDGNTNSRWSSDFLANQWWQVDLGAITALTSVDITFCDWAWPATYTVSVSTNGTTWTVVANETLTSSGSKRKISTFAQTNARYVRITGLTRGTQFGTSIVEAQIYGP